MTGNIVARRYARALFALGKQSGLPELDGYAAALDALGAAQTAEPALAKIFRNPIFSTEEKKGLVAKLAQKLSINGVVRNFLLLLAEKGRMDAVSAVTTVFHQLLDAEKGVLRGELLTAVPLEANKRAAVVKQLEKKAKRTLMLDFGVSPEILGGVVLKVGDQVMDASLRAQLSILKDTIKRGE